MISQLPIVTLNNMLPTRLWVADKQQITKRKSYRHGHNLQITATIVYVVLFWSSDMYTLIPNLTNAHVERTSRLVNTNNHSKLHTNFKLANIVFNIHLPALFLQMLNQIFAFYPIIQARCAKLIVPHAILWFDVIVPGNSVCNTI